MQAICEFLAQVLAAAPNNFGFLLLAATGAMLAERSGLGVLCLEAFATLGAVAAACAVTHAGLNLGGEWGLAVGAVAGAMVGLLHWWVVRIGRVDAVVNAIVLNLLAPAVALFVLKFGLNREQISRVIDAPLQSNAAVVWVIGCVAVAGMFFVAWAWHRNRSQRNSPQGLSPAMLLAVGLLLLVCALLAWCGRGDLRAGLPVHLPFAVLLFALAALALERGKVSRWIAAVGKDAEEAALAGVPVGQVRLVTGLLCGAMCGLAGAGLVLGHVNSFSKGVVAERGYLAVAAVVLGGWRWRGVALACLVLSLFGGTQTQLQGGVLGTALPFALPYVAVVCYLFFRRGEIRVPRELMRLLREPLPSLKFRVGLILARGTARDASVNQYLLEWWQRKGGRLVAEGSDIPLEPVPVSKPLRTPESLGRVQKHLARLARRHSHIVGVGSPMIGPFSEFAKQAGDWPRLAIIDGEDAMADEWEEPRIHGLQFAEDQQGAPAGYLAAQAATLIGKPSVVFLGGAPLPAVRRWADGFRRGVQGYNRANNSSSGFVAVSFFQDFVGQTDAGFLDEWAARRLTEYFVEFRGVGIVCQACGKASRGVLDAVHKARMKGHVVFVVSTDWASEVKSGKPPFGGPDDAVLFVVERRLEQRIAEWVNHDRGVASRALPRGPRGGNLLCCSARTGWAHVRGLPAELEDAWSKAAQELKKNGR